MSEPGSPTARKVVMLAVGMNILVHLGLVTAGLLEENGSLMQRAGIYTDMFPVPVNAWSVLFHFPAMLAAGFTLAAIQDRMSPLALVLPQLAFLVVSSVQTALVARGLYWLWGRVRGALRGRRA
ncbi:hypothetical protein [Pyxidicoccus xibeiensis]|uniref:hypothetical protein n=1 Tax=Pyxidicoccus xibeiensis TaxID=2906759 RepID=UPI0020A713D2|nr:hypothetical protein [Pyxidicoccus xibeiensis]MCP3143032.1 hypothetical protein [Pyxidicoccus xibeiensis]